MDSQVSFCPVPEEQQPIKEYQQLQQSWFFAIALANWFGFGRKLIWIWLGHWIISAPLTDAVFPFRKYPLQFALCGSAGSILGVVLILLRLYLAWRYIRDRLYTDTVIYEESGWYDGQTWTKPPEILARDRLIVTYEVKPILHKLELTFGMITLIYAIGFITWMIIF